MLEKKLTELCGTEVLGRAIISSEYQVILPEGAVLKPEYIQKLEELGIQKVFTKDDTPITEEVVILKADVQNKVKEKVKEVLEHHTYQNSGELEELIHEAENVISNIMEEEEVVEKVYDIKERSADVYEHSLNLCSLSVVTACKLGLSEDKIHDMGVACLLHDLGLRYLTIDYADQDIKTLSPQDLTEFKKHPIYAYSALKEESWISEVSKNIILYHHERKDGSGYPLRATNISEEMGIVQVCDTFDEMICGVGCKKVKVHEAVRYLKQNKGIKFDSKIVDEFLNIAAVYPAGTMVLTNEGETAIVIRQNKEPDRPVIRILKDRLGNNVTTDITKDLLETETTYIESVID
ncbi:MAG: HD domain-containing protein [Lachnospiraceae bacterium]|nr:HD domain-containing protein [Lachnospiraceae bacterium]